MARARNEAPPGADDTGMFHEGNRHGATTTEDAARVGLTGANTAPPAEEPKPQGRTTTRGMLPEIKAVDACYKELSALTPAEARWVLDFLILKFPKPEGR